MTSGLHDAVTRPCRYYGLATNETQVTIPPLLPTIEYVMEMVPLRFPVLLVDSVLEWIPGERIVAVKAFTANEPFFGTDCLEADAPVEALVIESMVQVAGLTLPKRAGKYVYLLSFDKVVIHRAVHFGDLLVTRAAKVFSRRNMFRVAAESKIEDATVISGEITYAYMDSPAS